MRTERARDQSESPDEQDKHYERIEKAGRPKIDVHVCDYAAQDEKGARDSEKPAGSASAVPK